MRLAKHILDQQEAYEPCNNNPDISRPPRLPRMSKQILCWSIENTVPPTLAQASGIPHPRSRILEIRHVCEHFASIFEIRHVCEHVFGSVQTHFFCHHHSCNASNRINYRVLEVQRTQHSHVIWSRLIIIQTAQRLEGTFMYLIGKRKIEVMCTTSPAATWVATSVAKSICEARRRHATIGWCLVKTW